MNKAIIGLGSNIQPEKNLPEALRRLSEFVKILAVSSQWQTTAVGTKGPPFLNATILVETAIERAQLKSEVLAKIENELGRVRISDKFAPRTIDLDILVFNADILDKNLFFHDYLILPAAEIIPELIDPQTKRSLKELSSERCCGSNAVNLGKLVY